MTTIIGRLIGFLALAVTILCYQFNAQKKILLAQIIASSLFMANLLLLGQLSGACLNLLGIARACVFYQRGLHRWASHVGWVVFFSLASVAVSLCTYQSFLDLLPAAGMVFTTIALYVTDPAKIRLFTLPSPPCWFVYHLAAGNPAGALNEIFVVTSVIIGIIRLDRKPKKRES